MKKILYSILSIVLVSSLLTNTIYASEHSVQSNSVSNDIDIAVLNESYTIVNATLKDSIYTVYYKSGNNLQIVVYDGQTGLVTINGDVQEGVSFEYDPSRELKDTTSSSQNEFTIAAAKPKKGYKYVGTLRGHTKTAKNAASLAAQLSLTIPGMGWSAKVVTVLLGTAANTKIPSRYYEYDLYQKGFMTNKWYQYSTVRFYKDKKYKKRIGKTWTSKPKKIDLPNS
ncbi:hypothetical protein [Siminovitchia sp. 179-K 8D1 HS]|uniref:hypothetical protein n=1 Tax=Siminovitchia sp. 179-K 8D1 HS TaxID=3142385 RepID=UPI00399F191E